MARRGVTEYVFRDWVLRAPIKKAKWRRPKEYKSRLKAAKSNPKSRPPDNSGEGGRPRKAMVCHTKMVWPTGEQ
jgi:hypothetical protein